MINFFKQKRSLDTYLLWFFRVLMLSSVVYLVFFNQEKTVTDFNVPRANGTDVIDYQIEQNRVADSVIKQMKNEKINLDSLSDDSIKSIILRSNISK